MDIKISALRETLDILLNHVEQSGQSEISIAHDFYWNVRSDALYDRYDEPANLDVGQLTEDWERLQKIRMSENPPVADGLVWLAAILRAVGDEITR